MPVTERGFSLLELLVATVLLGMVLLGVAPMFLSAIEKNSAGADMGTIGAAAIERLELLRAERNSNLVLGGSLTANDTVAGVPYFDDSQPGFIVRWRITGGATAQGGKRIAVRALATRQVSGVPKEVLVTTIRGTS